MAYCFAHRSAYKPFEESRSWNPWASVHASLALLICSFLSIQPCIQSQVSPHSNLRARCTWRGFIGHGWAYSFLIGSALVHWWTVGNCGWSCSPESCWASCNLGLVFASPLNTVQGGFLLCSLTELRSTRERHPQILLLALNLDSHPFSFCRHWWGLT